MAQTAEMLSDLSRTAQRQMQSGDFAGARKTIAAILKSDPKNTDGLYMAAVCARYAADYGSAHDYLQRLKHVQPDYGRAYQEEGHLLRAEGRADEALRAFSFATRYNPALAASWAAQVELLAAAGRLGEANDAQAQLVRLKSLPRELFAVTNHLHEGRILRAEEIARAFLKQHPHNIEGMRLLADIGSRLGVHEDAEFLLATAIELAPDNPQLRIDYINVLRKRQKFADALAQARALLEFDPNSPTFLSMFAIESMQSGDYDTALETFEKVLAKLPHDPLTLTSRGHALKTAGQSEEAVASYRAAIAADPLNGDAWYALANLKTYRFTDEEVDRMKAVEHDPNLSVMSRIHVAFALGKAFEDRKTYAAAFEHYSRGNSLKRTSTRYTTEQMQEEFEAQRKHCTQELFAKRAGVGAAAPDPIFILGLPRAGSTLLEQILASHSQVDGTLELPNILSLAHTLRGRKHLTDRELYPRILHELPDEELRQMGEDYIANTRIHRQGAPFFTDKMPNNFRHIGLIHLILPNAKIIDARRAPMDCCWSGFKQLFAEGQEFTYGLEDISHYYRAYVELMDHWDTVLPDGRILRVQHEDVIEDLEGQVRRILDYCGLAFEQACIDFHKTERAVRTASSEQVRRPISRAGVEQWRPFEAYLEPLKSALGPALANDRGPEK